MPDMTQESFAILELDLDTNISKKALNFFLEILIKIRKFLQNLL